MVVVNEQRRVSARIQEKQREEELRLVKRRLELLSDDNINVDKGAADDEKKAVINARRGKRMKVKDVENLKEEEREEKGKVSVETTTSSGADVVNGNVVNIVEKSDHAKVKETLRLFNKYHLLLVKEKEQRCLQSKC